MHAITRKSLLIALIAIIAFTLAACSSGNNTNEPKTNTPPKEENTNTPKEPEAEPPVKKDPVELTVGSWASESEQKSVEDWFAAFQKTHPHVTLKYIGLEGDPGATALTMAASGNMPDVVWLADAHVRSFYEQGVVAPLNDDRVEHDHAGARHRAILLPTWKPSSGFSAWRFGSSPSSRSPRE